MNPITYFPEPPAAAEIPSVMPSPFSDQPHPLAKRACAMLQQRLASGHNWSRNLFSDDAGKMFGVLVVRDQQGEIGFLSGFSAMMGGQWLIPGFVPPLFDPAKQQLFLPAGKAALTALAEQLEQLENSSEYARLKQQLLILEQQRDSALSSLKQQHKTAKAVRKQQRLQLQQSADADELQSQLKALALASQHHKREATDARLAWQKKLQHISLQLDHFEQQLSRLRKERAEQSRKLHQQVFDSYQLFNSLGEQQGISHFFPDSTPPAGAGDCAGPKLIHFALQQQLQPLALAEFWWGASPAAGVRHHKQYYPACRGKCRPILPFMLQGLAVEHEPCYGNDIDEQLPEVVYEDDVLIVINKPAGLMSVPGKEIKDCVFNRLLKRYPDCPELRLVHRLDMSTSGLLLVAKNLKINKQLQKQFIRRTVDKRYEALLSKVLSPEQQEGDIDLPLRVDFDDRPRQLVCYEYGKPARSHWQVISRSTTTTRVYLYPHTGRTHQLRVHASHRDGLNAAIVGDDLYGLAGERLMLHAQRLCFDHPLSRERLQFEIEAPF